MKKRVIQTDCTLQFEMTECGAASLSILLKYYGKYVTLADLRMACCIGRDGSSAKKILIGASRYGLEGKVYKLSTEETLSSSELPLILFWNNNHFLVLEGVRKNEVYLSDPAEGRRKVSIQEFNQLYTGFCISLKPSSKFKKGGFIPSPFSILLPYLKSYSNIILLATLLGLASSIPTLIYAGSSQEFVNTFLQDGRVYFGLPIIWILSLGISLNALVNWLGYLLLRRLQLVFINDSSLNIFERLLSLEYGYFSQRLTGELSNRISIALQLPQMLIGQILKFVIALAKSLTIMIIALFVSPVLVVMISVIVLANISFSLFLINIRKDDNRMLALDTGKATAVSLQSISQIESIKSSGIEFDFIRRWQEKFIPVVRQNQLLGQFNAYSSTVSSSSGFLLNVLTVIVGGLLIVAGKMSLGELVAFQLLQSQVIAPVTLIPQISGQYQQLIGSLARLADIYDCPTDQFSALLNQSGFNKDSSKEKGSLAPGSNQLHKLLHVEDLTISNLNFSYDGSDKYFLKNISLNLEKAKHYAFVGSSGSGKSTLIKLIVGLYQPTNGEIRYNSHLLSEIDKHSIKELLGYVPQDPFVFNGTIKENLTLYNQAVSDSDVWQACKLAQIDKHISCYPDTIHHFVRDGGADLSGGQRQRIEIARVLLRNPSFIILDEATSALDEVTEKAIINSVLSNGTTVISAAHRMASAIASDYVFVFDSGSILEHGSPDTLLSETGSRFYQLCKSDLTINEFSKS